MSYYSSGPMQKLAKARQAQALAEALVPKRFAVLRYMIDGVKSYSETYGGKGKCYLNFRGGFGIDKEVRRMIKRGEIIVSRGEHHHNSHGGNPTINATVATVTDKGRLAYDNWKRRTKGRN